MTDNSEYSIAVGEKPFRDVDDDVEDRWYHASLLLMKNGDDGEPEVIQQLHFNNSNGWVLTPNVRGPSEKSLSESGVEVITCVSGSDLEIMQKWNKALRQGHQIKEQHLVFGDDYRHSPTDLNCRAGVKAAIEAMGVRFEEAMVKSRAGIQCDAISVLSLDDRDETHVTIEDLMRENEELSETLVL